MAHKKGSTVFGRNLLIDLLIVLVFTLMLWPLADQVDTTVRRQELKERRAVLTNAMDELGQEIYFLRTLMFQARTNDYFSRLAIIDGRLVPSDYIAISSTHKYVSTIAAANPMVADVLVIMQGPGLVITKGTSYHSFAEFKRLFSIVGQDADELLRPRTFDGRRGFAYGPSCTLFSSSSGAAKAAFSCSLPLLTDGKAMVILFFQEQSFRASLLSEHLEAYASLCLTDAEGNLLYACSPEGEALPAPGQEGYESLTIENADSALKLTFWLPERYFSDTLKDFRQMLTGLISLATFIAVLAAVYFAFRQSQPMRRLLNAFAAQNLLTPERRNEYEWIKSSMLAMHAEHADILLQVENYKGTLRSLTLERLLNQGSQTREQLEKARSVLPDFPETYVIGYAQLEPGALAPERNEVRAMLAQRAMREALPKNTAVHVLSASEFALIIPCGEEEAASETFEQRLMTAKMPPNLCVRFSDPAAGLSHVNEAFEQARLRAVRMEDEAAVTVDGLSQKNLQKLYQCLLAAEEAQAVKALDNLLFRGDCAYTDMEQRYYAVRMQILLAAQEAGVCVGCDKYHAAQRPERLRENLAEALHQLCEGILLRQEKQSGRRREELTAYVRAHYDDELLCPASLAERFNVSERYIFTFFKENTGFSPANYIQQIRMEEAARMLKATELPVQEIGARCGFTNFNTYYKAFKRAYGVTPSKYRENARAGHS